MWRLYVSSDLGGGVVIKFALKAMYLTFSLPLANTFFYPINEIPVSPACTLFTCIKYFPQMIKFTFYFPFLPNYLLSFISLFLYCSLSTPPSPNKQVVHEKFHFQSRKKHFFSVLVPSDLWRVCDRAPLYRTAVSVVSFSADLDLGSLKTTLR
jgi:hypothetical protein